MRRSALARGLRVHIGIAATQTTAMVVALTRPGLTVVARGGETAALAPMAIGILEKFQVSSLKSAGGAVPASDVKLETFKSWGLRTLGDLAALPSSELSARLGRQGLVWQVMARGQDARPLVPTLADERFESSIELEWPIEGLEPLSFVLTRLLEPLSTRLERRDRGAAAIHIMLGLVTVPDVQRRARGGRKENVGQDSASSAVSAADVVSADTYTRSLQLPSPLRDVRALRTLILLDLESHSPAAPVDRVTVTLDPTPGRVLQHALFVRTQPTPEQLSTLIARLHALMGEDRVGRPARVDSYQPGAFTMQPFATDHDINHRAHRNHREALRTVDHQDYRAHLEPVHYSHHAERRSQETLVQHPVASVNSVVNAVSSVANVAAVPPFATEHAQHGNHDQRREREDRREVCVPAAASSADCAFPVVSALRRCRRPVPARVVKNGDQLVAVTTDRRGFAGGRVLACAGPWRSSGEWWEQVTEKADQPYPSHLPNSYHPSSWNHDEWEVALSDGAVYRIFQDRATDRWFVDAIVD
jgi:nucleotidyltransferase/DNA polymerase involved in DNA repair